MIIEVHRRESLNAPLQYNIKKLDECHAQILAMKWIPKDATGEELYACLEANALNARTKKPFFHINLNPALEDLERGLTDEQLTEMCKEAVERLFPEVPYVAFLHTDISRKHCHIVGPCITRDGRLISDRFEWNRAMKVSRELEIKYNLERALEHTEERRVNRAEAIRYEDGDLSRKIGDVLALASTYRFTRLGELNAFLNLYNCGFDQVNNDKKRGLSYYVLKDGQRVGRAIIATKIRGGALASIEKQMRNAIIKDKEFEELRGKLDIAIGNAINFEEVKRNLKRVNIRTVERIDPDGKILGVTFVDDELKIIANGSNIGREYSYSNIMKNFQFASISTPKIGFGQTNTQGTNTEIETETISFPNVIPDVSGLFFTGPVSITVNKRKKRRFR